MHNHSSSSIFIKNGIGGKKDLILPCIFKVKAPTGSREQKKGKRSSSLRSLSWNEFTTCRTVVCITL